METRDNPHSSLVLGDPSCLPSLQPGWGIKPSFFQTWLVETSRNPPSLRATVRRETASV